MYDDGNRFFTWYNDKFENTETIKIKNYDEIEKELVDMLIQFVKDGNSYQTDVYLYYDSDEETAELSLFQNVGGRSWLEDDHILIYRDKPHFDNSMTLRGMYYAEYDIAEALDMTEDELEEYIAKKNGIDVEDVDTDNIWDYVEDDDEMYEKIVEEYDSIIEGVCREVAEREAWEILKESFIEPFDNEITNEER